MKNILFLFFLFAHITSIYAQNGPGGVNDKLLIWLSSNENRTTTEWEEKSTNQKTFALGTTAPSISPLKINNQEILRFNGVNHQLILTGGLLDTISVSNLYIFFVGSPMDGNVGTLFYEDTDDNPLKLYLTENTTDNKNLDLNFQFGSQNNPTVTANILKPQSMLGLYTIGHSVSTTTAFINKNGNQIIATTHHTAITGNSSDFYIGTDNANMNHYSGDFAELIIYTAQLTTAEIQKIETYLSLKWNLPLLHNYYNKNYTGINANVSTVWEIDNNYKYNVVGVFNDDASGYSQTSNQKEGDILKISLSQTDKLVDNNYLIWASNSENNEDLQKLPTSFQNTAALKKTWKIKKTNINNTTNFTLSFDLKDNQFEENSIEDFSLIIYSTTIDTGQEIITNKTKTDKKIVFSKVTFSDEISYVTLGIRINAPGGLHTGLQAWYRSDKSLKKVGDEDATADDESFVQWKDFTGLNNHFSDQTSATYPHTYHLQGPVDFPYLRINAATDELKTVNTIDIKEVFIVLKQRNTSTNSTGFFGFSNGTGQNILNGNISVGNTNDFALANGIQIDGNQMTTLKNDWQIITLSGRNNIENQQFILGAYQSTLSPLSIDIAEMIVYGSDIQVADSQKIKSMLALKYSIPLKMGNVYANLLNIDGTIVWNVNNHSGYLSEIGAIFRDDTQEVIRKKGRTSIERYALEIEGNPPNDASYLVWGSNETQIGLTASNIPTSKYVATTLKKWSTQEVNDTGNLTLRFNLTHLGVYGGINDLVILIDDDDNFRDLNPTNLTANQRIISGVAISQNADGENIATFNNVNLGNDEFFTLATEYVQAPAGVIDNLKLWVKTSSYDNTSNKWNDLSPHNQELQGEDAAKSPVLTDQDNGFNGNSVLSFNGTTQRLSLSNGLALKQGNIENMNVITVIESLATENSVNRIFYQKLQGSSNDFYVDLPNNFSNITLHIGGMDAITTAYGSLETSNVPTIYSFKDEENIQNLLKNGSSIANSNGTYNFNNSNSPFFLGGSENSYFKGKIGEFIVYDDKLLYTHDLLKIETYLSLKWKMQINHNYYSSFYDGNNVNETIWGIDPQYNNEITAIGLSLAYDFNRNKAKKVPVNDFIEVQVNGGGNFSNDESYVFWANNRGSIEGKNDVPPTLSNVLPVPLRIERVWKFRKTRTTEGLDISFYINNFRLYNLRAEEFRILVDTEGRDFSDAQIMSQTPIKIKDDNGIYITFQNVILPAQNNYVTLAFGQNGPGGVTENLSLWLKADFVRSTFTNRFANDGEVLKYWENKGKYINHLSDVEGDELNNFFFKNNELNINGYPFVRLNDVDRDLLTDKKVGMQDVFLVLKLNKIEEQGGVFGETSGLGIKTFGTKDHYNEYLSKTNGGDRSNFDDKLFMIDGNPNQNNHAGKWHILHITKEVTLESKYYLGGYLFENEKPLNADFAEMVAYGTGTSVNLSNEKRVRILSYLSLKYGIPLEQTAELKQTYKASNNLELWNPDDNQGYNNAIAGIGRDDESEFENLKGSSNHAPFLEIIHKGDFDNNLSFILWGDNGEKGLVVNNLPRIVDDNVDIRTARIWKVKTIGTALKNVDIAFNLLELNLSGKATDFTLIKHNSDVFSDIDTNTGGKITRGGIIRDNFIIFSNVTLNTENYITLGLTNTGPAAQWNNLSLWLKADELNLNDKTPLTATDIWKSSTLNEMSVIVGESTQTTFSTNENGINNYGVIRLNSVQDYLESSAPLSVSDLNDNLSSFIVYRNLKERNEDKSGSVFSYSNRLNGALLHSETSDNPSLLFGKKDAQPSVEEVKLTSEEASKNNVKIVGIHLGSGKSQISVNGKYENQKNTGTIKMDDFRIEGANEVTKFRIGKNLTHPAISGGAALIDIAEIIHFNTQISDEDKQKMNTYLSIKYGVTIDQTNSKDYINSKGDVIWSVTANMGYNENIAGIINDDNAKFSLAASQSSNENVGLHISAHKIPSDTSLLWGSNGKKSLNITNLPSSVSINTLNVHNRIWKVQEVGGDTELLTLIFNIQHLAILGGKASDYGLILSPSAEFTTSNSTYRSNGTLIGNHLTFREVNLGSTNAIYIGLGFVKKIPGRVPNNLAFWLEAATYDTTKKIWKESSGFKREMTFPVVNINQIPSKKTGIEGVNNQPVISFDGLNDFLTFKDGVVEEGQKDIYIFSVNQTENLSSRGVLLNEKLGDNKNLEVVLSQKDGKSAFNFGDNSDQLISANSLSNEVIITSFGNTNENTKMFIEINGKQIADKTKINSINSEQNNDLIIGSNTEKNAFFTGKLAELLIYNGNLQEVERKKINTYLALKYGITLEHEYLTHTLNPDTGMPVVLWNPSSTDSEYKLYISGIMKSNEMNFEQNVSKSANEGAILTVSLSTSNSLTNEESYLLWGRNYKVFGSAIELPPNTLDVAQLRSNLVWKIKKKNIANSTSFILSFNLTNTPYETNKVNELKLLIDQDYTSFVDAVSVEPTSISNGIAVFDNIEFTNPETYLSLAFGGLSPGGVKKNLSAWLSADNGVENTGNIAVTTNNSTWSSWKGLLNKVKFDDVETDGTLDNQWFNKHIDANGHPYIRLNNAEADLQANLPIGVQQIIAVVRVNSQQANAIFFGGTPNNVISLHNTDLRYQDRSDHSRQWATNQGVSINGKQGNTFTLNKWHIVSIKSDESISNRYFLGGNVENQNGITVDIAEFITYSTTLSQLDFTRVKSYLSINYGIPLNQESPQNYSDSSGILIWNATANNDYNHSIIGIGKDNITRLNQLESISIDNTTLTLNTNSNGILDKSYLLCGNNNQSGYNYSSGIEGVITLKRIWKTQVTGTLGKVSVSFDLSTLGLNIPFSSKHIVLIKNETNDFSSILKTDIEKYIVGGVITNNVIKFSNITFKSGDVFTLGVLSGTPAAETNKLVYWLKDFVTNTEVISSNVQNVQSFTRLPNAIAQPNVQLKIKTYAPTTLQMNTVGHLEIPNLYPNDNPFSTFIVYKPTAINKKQILMEGSDTQKIFNIYLDRNNKLNSTFGSNNFIHNTVHNSNESYITGISYTTDTNNQLIFSVNGEENVSNFTSPSTSLTTIKYLLGNSRGDEGFEGEIAEFIAYQNNIPLFKRQVLESYLALKYGISIQHSYFTSLYDGTNATTETIWDFNSAPFNQYNHRIFGLSRSDRQGLNVLNAISTKSNLMRLSISEFAEDESYIAIGDDNADVSLIDNTPYAEESKRVKRLWFINRKTNSNAIISITFNLTALNINYHPQKTYRILIDNDNNFIESDLLHNEGVLSTINGDQMLKFDNVILDRRQTVFSLLVTQLAPASITNGLHIWLLNPEADTSSTTTNNAKIPVWENEGEVSTQFVQIDTTLQPEVSTNNIKNFPCANFTDTEYLSSSSNNILLSNQAYTKFIIFRNQASPTNAILLGDDTTTNQLKLEKIDEKTILTMNHYETNYNKVVSSSEHIVDNRPYFATVRYSANVPSGEFNSELRLDGRVVGQNNHNNGYTGSNLLTLGKRFIGCIAEVIIYNRRLSNEEVTKVETYLSIKYGIPYKGNFINERNDLIWNVSENPNHSEEIIGFGRNDISQLYTTEAYLSTYDTDNLINTKEFKIKASLINPDSYASIRTKSYLLIGKNNMDYSNYEVRNSLDTKYESIGTVWKVSKKGTVGVVKLSFAKQVLSSICYKSNVFFVKSKQMDFSSATKFDFISTASTYSLDINLEDGDYFTIFLQESPKYTRVQSNENIVDGRSVEVTLTPSHASNLKMVVNFSPNTNNMAKIGTNFTFSKSFIEFPSISNCTHNLDPQKLIVKTIQNDFVEGAILIAYKLSARSGVFLPKDVFSITIDDDDGDLDKDGVSNYEERLQGSSTTDVTEYLDSDGDGYPDSFEVYANTDPKDANSFSKKDTDNDLVADLYEMVNETDPNDQNSYLDTDKDRVPNRIEKRDNTSLISATSYKDTDCDRVPDYMEDRQNTDNTDYLSYLDTDKDSVPDYVEIYFDDTKHDLITSFKDSDEDAVADYFEVRQNCDKTGANKTTIPTDKESFIDENPKNGIPDYVEMLIKASPIDSDNDLVPDVYEILIDKTDPKDPFSFKDTRKNKIPDYQEILDPSLISKKIIPSEFLIISKEMKNCLPISGLNSVDRNAVHIYNREGVMQWTSENYDNNKTKFCGENVNGEIMFPNIYFLVIERFNVNGSLDVEKFILILNVEK